MKINKQQDLNTAYNKAFKFRFYPDSEQVSLLNHFFGSARFVFNQTLNYSINHYQSKEHLITDDYGNLITINNDNFTSLSSTDRINYIKELKIINPWLKEISSIVLQQSIINLNNAYINFFIIYNYNEDNAKKVIQNVLTYHKNKMNHLPDKDNKPGKLKLNNKLLFNININKTQA